MHALHRDGVGMRRDVVRQHQDPGEGVAWPGLSFTGE
jgi:hypothetical protein